MARRWFAARFSCLRTGFSEDVNEKVALGTGKKTRAEFGRES